MNEGVAYIGASEGGAQAAHPTFQPPDSLTLLYEAAAASELARVDAHFFDQAKNERVRTDLEHLSRRWLLLARSKSADDFIRHVDAAREKIRRRGVGPRWDLNQIAERARVGLRGDRHAVVLALASAALHREAYAVRKFFDLPPVGGLSVQEVVRMTADLLRELVEVGYGFGNHSRPPLLDQRHHKAGQAAGGTLVLAANMPRINSRRRLSWVHSADDTRPLLFGIGPLRCTAMEIGAIWHHRAANYHDHAVNLPTPATLQRLARRLADKRFWATNLGTAEFEVHFSEGDLAILKAHLEAYRARLPEDRSNGAVRRKAASSGAKRLRFQKNERIGSNTDRIEFDSTTSRL